MTKHSRDPQRTMKDPVCGMLVSQKTAPEAIEHDGRTYYFCSDLCRERFEADPDAYIPKGAGPGSSTARDEG